VDHAGQPANHKSLIQLYLGFNLEDPTGNDVIDVEVVLGNDWPVSAYQSITTTLDKHRDKMLVGRTGRFMTYEIANSRPDEQYLVTYIDPNIKVMGRRRP
jgi:hypothetical protein